MPSKNKQLNMRLRPEVLDRLERIRDALAQARGTPISQPAAVSEALLELERQMFPDEPSKVP